MKRILMTIILMAGIAAVMQGQLATINVSTPNSGEGDSYRQAFKKANAAINLLNSVRLYDLNSSELLILNGALVTTAELNRSVGLRAAIQTQIDAKEDSLGRPGVSGYVLSSTTAGIRSWIAPGSGSMVYPGAGIPLSTGSAWGTSITNNSANWNTSYGWGDHASVVSALNTRVDSIVEVLADSVSLSEVAPLLADTIPLFIFGLGGGLAADTASFNDNAIAGAFFNSGSDTLAVTSLRGVLAEGTGTETIGVQVSWHSTFKSVSATNLNSAAYTVTSITTGNEDTAFANSKIPPGVWVWCTVSAVSAGNRPSLLILTLAGYKCSTY